MCGASCVDGPCLARDHLACSAEVACSHVSGLLVQSGWTAGPDGVREPSPHHSNGIDVPMKRPASESRSSEMPTPRALAVVRLITSLNPSLQDGAVSRAFERRIAPAGLRQGLLRCGISIRPMSAASNHVRSTRPPTLTRHPLWSESDGSAERGTG